MAGDPAWAQEIVERPQVLGVDAMSADGLTIKITARTVPQKQDAFARALRARIASRLRAEGIVFANDSSANTNIDTAITGSGGVTAGGANGLTWNTGAAAYTGGTTVNAPGSFGQITSANGQRTIQLALKLLF